MDFSTTIMHTQRFAQDKNGEPDNKAYLTKMPAEKIVQFVCFETSLAINPFLSQWEQYNRSGNSDLDITIQESEKNGVHRYIAQHHCRTGEFCFQFSKARKPPHVSSVEIKTKQAGGYSVVKWQRRNETNEDESKVFAFLPEEPANLDRFNNILPGLKPNIYQPYFENCQYACILEFFVNNEEVPELMRKLKLQVEECSHYADPELGIYKECAQLSA